MSSEGAMGGEVAAEKADKEAAPAKKTVAASVSVDRPRHLVCAWV